MIVQFILTICAFFVYFWFKNRNKGLPPGPIRLPVLGSVVQLFRANSQYPHLALAKLSEKYGGIMTIGFGMNTAVVVSSYEIMKDAFKHMETNLHRFEFPFVSDRNYGKNLGIIFGSGQVWVDVRRFTMKILKEFGYGKAKIMDQSLTDSANQLIDDIKTEISESANGTYCVHSQKFAVHVVNVLWNMVGGYKFEPNDVLLRRNMELENKLLEIASHKNPYNLFPFLKDWFPNLMRYPDHLETHKQLHEYKKVIEKSNTLSCGTSSRMILNRRNELLHFNIFPNDFRLSTLISDAKAKRSQRFDSEPTSFIEVFLDKIEKHHGDPDTIFTEEQLELILSDLFAGGSETSGTLLNWSLLFLVQNPDTQSKLRREINDKRENGTDILHSTKLKKMPYLSAIILETLRMGNVIPVPSPRHVMSDVKIKDYLIPKGSLLLYNLYSIFNDKNYWKDPENFRPERYLNEYDEIDQKLADRIMSVFGFGGRVCFGQTLALDTIFIFLATLVMHFEFHPIPGEEPSAESPVVGMTITPREYSVRITTSKI